MCVAAQLQANEHSALVALRSCGLFFMHFKRLLPQWGVGLRMPTPATQTEAGSMLTTATAALKQELFSMIVVMEKGANKSQIEHMVERVETMGLKAHVIYGTERTVIAAIGDKREYMRESLESGPGVAEVVPIFGAL